MLNQEKKVIIEWQKEENVKEVSNPIESDYSTSDKLALMIVKVLDEELPMIKNNSLLYDLVLYSLLEKMKTIQNVKNVVSYIKKHNGKSVSDVSFKNGEVLIKCSV